MADRRGDLIMENQSLAKTGREDLFFYTGPTSSHFSPILSGITYQSPFYEIRRPDGSFYVFEYVISGIGHVQHGNQNYIMQEGDAYILHDGQLHHYFSDKKDPWKKIWFNVNGSLVRHLLSDYGLDSVVKIPSFGNPGLLSEITRVMDNDPAHCGEELAILLHRHIQALSAFLGDQTTAHSPAQLMKSYIEQNLTRALSIEEIAGQVHLSRSRAIHLFRETFQTTPYQYYLTQKLQLAQTLLESTNLSIQEISERLGFTDYHHFSDAYKKWCGISPSGYRTNKNV